MNNKRVMKNALWIIVCQCAQSILSLVITMFTARYLGPSNYGVLNYAISVTAFALPIALLGLNAVLVQEIVNKPESEGAIIGTAIGISLISSVLCILGVISFTYIANSGEQETVIVCGLYSLMMIFQSLQLIQYWFQAKLLSKYTALIGLFAYLVVTAYKIYLLITGKSIYWFAVSYVLDYAIISFGLIYLYFRNGGDKFSFSKAILKSLISKSKYYILSTLMVTVFAQQDKIMIKMLLGNSDTGLYSAAVSCATMSGFAFVAIIDSVRPMIFENKKIGKQIYENTITSLYSIIIYLCLIQGIVVVLFPDLIVKIIYGTQYLEAVPSLRIIIWYSAFSYIGGIRDIWLLAENKQKYLTIINFGGMIVNFLLNFILIPLFGIEGAAIASLLTQMFTNVGMTFFIKDIRRNNHFVFEAIKPKYALDLVKKMKFIFIKGDKNEC